MREKLARAVSISVISVLTILAFVFSWMHNPPIQAVAEVPTEGTVVPPAAEELSASPSMTSAPQDERTEAGRTVYMDQACATCHSIEGTGNPRYPLDGVGTRWEPDEIRLWITGTGFVADILPEAIVRRKQRYQELSEEALGTLILYLSTLKTEP